MGDKLHISSGKDRAKQLQEIINKIKIEKEKDIIAYVESRINNHIKKLGTNKISINYDHIEKRIGYKLPDEVIVNIIKNNYRHLGYRYEDYSDRGGFLYLPDNEKNNCIII